MLSIILPSYKGSEILSRNLPLLIEYLYKRNIGHEIIVVDDGSGDGGATQHVAVKYHCIFLQNECNLGKGAAVRKGMIRAKGEYRIFTDADIPFEFDALEQFLRYLDFKEFDVVIGDRTLPGSAYFTEISKTRKFSSGLFSFLVGRFVTGGMLDTQCGLKGFKAAVAEDLFSVSRVDGFAFDVELLYIALKRNYDVKRLPVKLRTNETSTIRLAREGIKMVADILTLKLNHVRGRYKKRSIS
jgi:dolichyl-phosphate beta-glucosyltransferase